MLSFLKSKSQSPKNRRRVRRLRAEPLENRRVLAGGIDVCLPAAEAAHHDGPAEESAAPRFGPELRRHSSRTIALPFRIRGGGPASEGLPLVEGWTSSFESSGRAFGLGRYTGTGNFTLGTLNIDPDTGAVTGTFQGDFVFKSRFGGELATTFGDGFTGEFTGQLIDGVVVDVEFDAFFRPDPENSTGRFKRVVGGGWRMIAKSDAVALGDPTDGFTDGFEYTWSGKGKLEYAKRGR